MVFLSVGPQTRYFAEVAGYLLEIRPQPRQELALSSRADITIYGGAAGSGKSWCSLLNPLRAINKPGFTGIVFRRTTKQLRGAGGLWEESKTIYPHTGARFWESSLEWKWRTRDPNKPAVLQFAHMEHDANRLDYQSKHLAYICFEELTHFTEKQFWYMPSRNRTKAPGVVPWMFATCNPDPDSFVRPLIDWWIGEDGFPIWDRSGVLRYWTRHGGEFRWVEEGWKSPEGYGAQSLTFIPAKLTDNAALLAADPGYEEKLANLPWADQQRLLHGNWNIRDGDSMFARQRVQFGDVPSEGWRWVRAWDRGARSKALRSDVDLTAGALVGHRIEGKTESLFIGDLRTLQGKPAEVERLIRATADADGPGVPVVLEEEFGASGKEATHYYKTRVLPDRQVIAIRPSGDKTKRAKPWCAMAEREQVACAHHVAGVVLQAMASFPAGGRDVIDCISLGYAALRQLAAPTKGGVVNRPRRNVSQWF